MTSATIGPPSHRGPPGRPGHSPGPCPLPNKEADQVRSPRRATPSALSKWPAREATKRPDWRNYPRPLGPRSSSASRPRRHLEAGLRSAMLGWSAGGHGSLVEVLVEAASSVGTGTSRGPTRDMRQRRARRALGIAHPASAETSSRSMLCPRQMSCGRRSVALKVSAEGNTRLSSSRETAISLPDDTYEQATRRAAELGTSRSEFCAPPHGATWTNSPSHRSPGSQRQRCRPPMTTQRCRSRRWSQLPGSSGRLVTQRGSICWVDLGEARGSRPAKRRPVLVIQSDPFDVSRLSTTIAAVIGPTPPSSPRPGQSACQPPSPACPRLGRQRHRPGHAQQDCLGEPAPLAGISHGGCQPGLRRVLGLAQRRP